MAEMVEHNSSVDKIERCVRFYRVAADFLEILSLEDDEAAANVLLSLQRTALNIIRKEVE